MHGEWKLRCHETRRASKSRDIAVKRCEATHLLVAILLSCGFDRGRASAKTHCRQQTIRPCCRPTWWLRGAGPQLAAATRRTAQAPAETRTSSSSAGTLELMIVNDIVTCTSKRGADSPTQPTKQLLGVTVCKIYRQITLDDRRFE